ncbi:Selenoprotein O [Aix galericulata]|nr:Selenoprotein O [Aix galericulata]
MPRLRVPWAVACFVWACGVGCGNLDPLCPSWGLCRAPLALNASPPGQGCGETWWGAAGLGLWGLSSASLVDSFPVDPIQENYVRNVKNCIFSVVYPTPFKSKVLLVAVSEDVIENILDLHISVQGTSDFLQFVSGGKVIFGSVPLAHRYGGHQFGSWAGQLGDGRAHLIGVYTNRHGERWELQLKGSGKTPYSRNGDGRAVLRSSVREFLCSEAMHYLGIPTSRAASLVVSDDEVWRDQFYNGNIKKERVVSETANLIALWMSVGFAHGVCNTDNFSLLSITIDYGPFGFMDSYDPNFVPNTSDDEGRYKIGNQANVGLFNLNKLLQALKPLLDPRQKRLASQVLEGYGQRYYTRYAVLELTPGSHNTINHVIFTELFRAKLGLLGDDEDDNYLIAFLLKLMEDRRADFTMTFRELSEITEDQLKELHIPEEFWALQDLGKHKLFSEWVSMYLLRLEQFTFYNRFYNIPSGDRRLQRKQATPYAHQLGPRILNSQVQIPSPLQNKGASCCCQAVHAGTQALAKQPDTKNETTAIILPERQPQLCLTPWPARRVLLHHPGLSGWSEARLCSQIPPSACSCRGRSRECGARKEQTVGTAKGTEGTLPRFWGPPAGTL